MGSYSECWLGDFYVGSIKNDFDWFLMSMFRAEDKEVITSKNELPRQLSRWSDIFDEDDNPSVVYYSTPAWIVRDRLELSGYTLKASINSFKRWHKRKIEEYEQRLTFGNEKLRELYDTEIAILRSLNFEVWLKNLVEILEKRLKPSGNKHQVDDPLISYMLRNKWYGFPGWDVSVVLRLVIDILPEQIDFIYDLTDLILGGYFNIDDDFANFSSEYNKEYDPDGKIIVLTEGKTDSYFLSESLSLFYPHLEDYFSFMDFDAARVGGGAGSLANIVKSFSGAGIINKVIAIFDNDTAAHSALRSLRKAKIAKNIKIMTLPEIKILESYPTLGPTGMVLMNVNGLAGSIETYLGEQSLRNVQGEYHPIQWTGFESGLKKYQGEITEKETIQNKFIEQLNLCKRDKSLITNYDWSGSETILKGMFEMFHSEDEQIILSKADE